MAFILPNSVFVHIPRTGGTWLRHSLLRSGLGLTVRDETGQEVVTPMKARVHMKPECVRSYTDKPMFTIVRDPQSWILSVYLCRVYHGSWVLVDEDDSSLLFNPSVSADSWITSLLTSRPGFITTLFTEYTHGIDTSNIGCFATLQHDAQRLVKKLEGVELASLPPSNPSVVTPPVISESTAKLIKEMG